MRCVSSCARVAAGGRLAGRAVTLVAGGGRLASRVVMLVAGGGRLASRVVMLVAGLVGLAGCAVIWPGIVLPPGGVAAGVADRIVFTSAPVPSDDPHDPDPGNDVYSMNRAGGDVNELTRDAFLDFAPALDPQGLFTAFASNDSAGGDVEIFLADARFGGQKINLTETIGTDTNPSFSPDGTRIVFQSDRDGDVEIYIMNVDGSGQMRLTFSPEPDIDPSFSPDGMQIVFSSGRTGIQQIFIMNVDGSMQRRITFTAFNETSPVFSPGGGQIAFTSDRDGDEEIYIMNANGGGQRNLSVAAGSQDRRPSFSPDGTQIAFQSDRDGNHEVYIMPLSGTPQINLTNSPTDDREPRFGPAPMP